MALTPVKLFITCKKGLRGFNRSETLLNPKRAGKAFKKTQIPRKPLVGLKAGDGAQFLGCFVGRNCGLNTVEEIR